MFSLVALNDILLKAEDENGWAWIFQVLKILYGGFRMYDSIFLCGLAGDETGFLGSFGIFIMDGPSFGVNYGSFKLCASGWQYR
jgi:hypothetical protein